MENIFNLPVEAINEILAQNPALKDGIHTLKGKVSFEGLSRLRNSGSGRNVTIFKQVRSFGKDEIITKTTEGFTFQQGHGLKLSQVKYPIIVSKSEYDKPLKTNEGTVVVLAKEGAAKVLFSCWGTALCPPEIYGDSIEYWEEKKYSERYWDNLSYCVSSEEYFKLSGSPYWKAVKLIQSW